MFALRHCDVFNSSDVFNKNDDVYERTKVVDVKLPYFVTLIDNDLNSRNVSGLIEFKEILKVCDEKTIVLSQTFKKLNGVT